MEETKIIYYTYVDADNPPLLEKEVMTYIKNGFQPFGSVYLWNKNLVQTMVKYEAVIKQTH